MDDDSECDWSPPDEIEVVESELFLIPSGLPSLEDFINAELEKEDATKLEEDDEESETILETHEEDDIISVEVPTENGPFTGEREEDEDAIPVTQDGLSDDDFEIPQVEVKKPKIKSKKHTDDSFGIDTVKIDFGSISKETKKDDEEALRLHLVDSTNQFIYQLIDRVVESCEYEDPDDVLRARLDKDKICEEFDDKMFQLDIEQKIRFFLNRKTVEYFRRKKATRPLMDDNPDDIFNQLRKYRESLMMVNKYKGLEVSTQNLLESKIAELREMLEKLETKSNDKAKEFVNIVKKVLSSDTSDKMEALIDSLTKKVRNMQAEISKVRFVLIQRQHAMAVLQEKSKNLDDLGNGLHMMDFEHLQTETQALGKKLEERNNELNRLHVRCNADIHTLSHIREKQLMLRSTISAQQEELDERLEEKQRCREFLNELKTERGSIRREFQDISFQNGILDKPKLLLDYDATDEKLSTLKTKIASIKAEQLDVDEKLKQMTEILH